MRKLHHQGTHELPVNFHDAATYFSEEEWKLLQEWQKDLYRNVMKEIHQALLSLGPLITTTVMSLKDRENEVLCLRNYPESESSHCDKHSPGCVSGISSVSLRIKGEDSQCLKHPQDKDNKEIMDHVGTGHQFVNPKTVERKSTGIVYTPESFPAVCPDMSLSTQGERELHFRDWACSEGSEINTQPHEGCSFLGSQMCWGKDEGYQTALVGLPKNGEEDSAGLNSEHEVISFIVKEEQEAWSFDSYEAKNRQSVHKSTAHDGIPNKQRKVDNSLQNRENISTCKISSIKTNMDMTIRSENEPSTINQLQSNSYLEFGTGNTSDGPISFRNPAHINAQTCKSYEKSESNLRDEHFLSSLRKANPVERLHTCTECKRGFSHKAVLVRHLRTHSRVRPYACNECKKSFFKKGDFTRHRRTHTGEKPFMCIDCHKRFNRKGNLDQHRILIHSGVRPFKCSECEKSFSRQCDLAKHIIKHQQINNNSLLTSVH